MPSEGHCGVLGGDPQKGTSANAQLWSLMGYDLLPGCRRSNHFFAALRGGPTQAGGSASDQTFVRGK